MPTAPFKHLTRRIIWSASASLALWFLTSTSILPSVPVPQTGFSLELERVLAKRPGLLLQTITSMSSATQDPEPLRLIQEGDQRRRATDRYLDSLPFGREIRGAAQRYGLDSLLLVSIVEAESSFRPDAVSAKGALGLMQLMPLHFVPSDRPLDPAVNLNLGARYLRDLRQRYSGDLELALAAYHAGPGAIDRFGGLPPYRETQHYVGRVLRLYSEHQRDAGATSPGKDTFVGDLPLRLTESGRGT